MKKQFKNIIDQHNGILYKIGRSYTTEEADFKDLYQEMLIQLWKSLDKFQGNSKVSTWMYRVALNTALTYRRKRKREKKSDTLDHIGEKVACVGTAGIEAMNQKEQKIELLYKCINLLKKEERAIILLHLDGKKYEEIAEIIGLTKNHVGVKIKRIKDRLQRLLKENNYGRI
ncbi:MAG: RNA polymerase sigma factor [Chitinophagales bacterium]